jgi:hypothetical protein
LKKIVLLLVAAGGAVFAYREIVLRAPDRILERFLDAWAREDTAAAAALTEGESAKKAVESKILRGVLKAPMEGYRGERVAIEGRESVSSGEVTLTAKAVVFFDPGHLSLGGARRRLFRRSCG